MTKQERSLFENQITPKELEKKLRELDKFIQNKKDENKNNPDKNSPNIKKLYDGAQAVVEALKKVVLKSVEMEQSKENNQGEEVKDDGKEQDVKSRVNEGVGRTLSALEKFMSESEEKSKKEEQSEEEQKKEEEKKTSLGQTQDGTELVKKKESEVEEEKKKKLELEEKEQKKEKEEKRLEKALEETRQTIEQILEHERKMQREASEKEGHSRDLSHNMVDTLEPSLLQIGKALNIEKGTPENSKDIGSIAKGLVGDLFKNVRMEKTTEFRAPEKHGDKDNNVKGRE